MATGYTVRALIDIDGVQLEESLERYVEEVIVDEHLELPAMFAITLHDAKKDILDRAGLRIGARVEIATVGLRSQEPLPLIDGEVVSIDCDYDDTGQRLVVRGYTPTHRLHRGRRTRTFVNVTDSEIVKRVAEEAGIEIGAVESTSKVYEHVTQANQSDWEFLGVRARAIGFELKASEGKLTFGPPAESTAAPSPAEAVPDVNPTDPRQLVYGKSLIAFHGRLSAAEQVGEVEVRGWDSQLKESFATTAPAGTVGAELELADPDTMAGFFGRPSFVSVNRPIAKDEAEVVAKALADRIGSSFAEADGIAHGTPELRAGTAVSISGVSEDFSGSYVLSHVRHVIDSEGYNTHFTVSGHQNRSLLGMVSTVSAAGTTLGAPAAGAGVMGLVRGVVDDNADPEKLGRVKVSLPWLDDQHSSAWAPVMQLGAGPESGTMFLPAVHDEVLVGFEHGQVDRPIVVGGLFNGVDKPPAYDLYLDNGAVHRRAIVSRLGHQVALSDDPNNESGIAIVTKDATVAIGLNARDKKLMLTCQGEVEIRSDGEMKLSGPKITMQADGELVLKGAQIKLN